MVSLVSLEEDTLDALDDAGIARFYEPMSSTFEPRHVEMLKEVLRRYRPWEIYIHCTHGVDRSGVTAAYLLATRHGWPIDDALWSVVADTSTDVSGLSALLADRGLQSEPPAFVSINSRMALGETGGMKVGAPYGARENPGYSRLINTTIDEYERTR